MLEVVGVEPDDALLAGWRERVDRVRARLGWGGAGHPGVAARRHGIGATLALAAPCDQLFTATEVNEWALCATVQSRDPLGWPDLETALVEAWREEAVATGDTAPPVIEEAAALRRLERQAASERRPRLRNLVRAAADRGLPWLLDDEWLTVGAGCGGRGYPLRALPGIDEVPWTDVHDIPTVLVTGSNGKTTTVRLVAACLRAQGRRTGYSCTDGLFIDSETLDSGDYSGPVGARTVLRDPRVEAAVLETARGGILRRGLAVTQARVAVVTNVSADHFGEYGIHDLGALGDVKLTVGSVVGPGGLLVLNADDATLRARALVLGSRFDRPPAIGWFARDADDAFLDSHRRAGGATCGVRGGRLVLARGPATHDLGAVADMPLSVGGRALYNVANLSAAALAAWALDVDPAVIAAVCARFGACAEDNPGRLMRHECGGVCVLVDYAHNPEGLRGLLAVAETMLGEGGRLGLVLGHAGNREDADLERLAATAASFRPSLVVVKELEGYLRGRQPGEVPRILRDALLRAGLPAEALPRQPGEVEAVRLALEWARPGDVLVLPVHGLAARGEVLKMIDGRSGGRTVRSDQPGG